MVAVVLNGFLTGLILQIAIGPVFFFILNISLQRTLVDGWLAVIGVTLADYIFIALAILGVGKLLENPRVKFTLGIISSLVLVLFGLFMMIWTDSSHPISGPNPPIASSPLSSFISAFLLTLSSPLTIVFWTSLFATKAIEKGYVQHQLTCFGIFAGLATPVFLGSSVTLLSLLRTSISLPLLKLLNIAVGGLLIIYGVIRLGKIVMNTGAVEKTNPFSDPG